MVSKMNILTYTLVIALGLMISTASLWAGIPLIVYGFWRFLDETIGKIMEDL